MPKREKNKNEGKRRRDTKKEGKKKKEAKGLQTANGGLGGVGVRDMRERSVVDVEGKSGVRMSRASATLFTVVSADGPCRCAWI